jgi:hypothetical protein
MSHTTATPPWPEIIMRSFSASGTAILNQFEPHYGSWNRLLNTVFPPDTAFEVIPCVPPATPEDAIDYFILFLIYVEATPVFMVEVRPPSTFRYPSGRRSADAQLRRQIGDLVTDMKTPVLHGISAVGTKMAFYKYSRDTNCIEPWRITLDPNRLIDLAPQEWWALDILEEEGAQKFKDIVEEVKEMCRGLGSERDRS